MLRFVTVALFALAAILAFVSDFTSANISLLFVVGLVAAGLACLAAEMWWHPRA